MMKPLNSSGQAGLNHNDLESPSGGSKCTHGAEKEMP